MQAFVIHLTIGLVFILWLSIFSRSKILRSPLWAVPFILCMLIIALEQFSNRIVYFMGSLYVAQLYIAWIALRAGKRRLLIFTPGLAIIQAISLVMLRITEVPFFIGGIVATSIATLLILWFTIYSSSQLEINNLGIIIAYVKIPMQVIFFIVTPLSFLVSIDGPFFNFILLTMLLALHFYIFMRLDRLEVDETNASITFVEENYEAVFDFMSEINTILARQIESESIDTGEVLDYVNAQVAENIRADASALLLVDEAQNVLNIRSVQGFFPIPYEIEYNKLERFGALKELYAEIGGVLEDTVLLFREKIIAIHAYLKSHPIQMGSTLLGEIANHQTPLFIQDSEHDPRTKQIVRYGLSYFSSMIAYPLMLSSKLYGVLCLVNRERNRFFSDQDFERSGTYVNYSSLVIESLYNYRMLIDKQKIEQEIDIAVDIQKQLLPKEYPADISVFSRPLKGVSGDYHDILQFEHSPKMGIVICDVAGKGVPASLIMVMIRTLLHSQKEIAQRSSTEMVRVINRGIVGQLGLDRFATISYTILNTETGELEYTNAAHYPTLVYRATEDRFELLDTPGLPVGITETDEYSIMQTRLTTGDVLISYTDGIVEVRNPAKQFYGDERLKTVIREQAVGHNAAELIRAVLDDIETFSDGLNEETQLDDMTLIIWKAER